MSLIREGSSGPLAGPPPAKRLKRLVCFSRSFILKLFRIYRKVARTEQRTLLLFSPRPRVEMFALISQWVCSCMHTHTRALAHSFPSGLQSALPQIWALQQNRRSLGPGETRGPEARPTGSVRPVRAFPFLVQGPVRKLCRVSLSCLGSLLPLVCRCLPCSGKLEASLVFSAEHWAGSGELRGGCTAEVPQDCTRVGGFSGDGPRGAHCSERRRR